MNNEVKISDIKTWTGDFLKWYRKKYYIDDIPASTESLYDIQNKYTMEVLESIFAHMEDDLAAGRKFSEQSKGYYDKLITPQE